MFLHYRSSEINQHSIYLEWQLTSDHVLLSITIPIVDEIINTSKLLILIKSEQKVAFIEEIISSFENLDTSNIVNKECLEDVVNNLDLLVNQAWNKNMKRTRITKYSKKWWTDECNKALTDYRASRSLDDWKTFKKVVKNTKRSFFNTKIREVADKSRSP